jgi:hypothetical protein
LVYCDLAALEARAADFARTSRSAATESANRSDWADFEAWCRAAVGAYFTDRSGHLKVATLNGRIAAITGGTPGGGPSAATTIGRCR